MRIEEFIKDINSFLKEDWVIDTDFNIWPSFKYEEMGGEVLKLTIKAYAGEVKGGIDEQNRAQKTYNKIVPGSLVFTNHENYFISVGLGKIEIDNEIYYSISAESPIGKVLLHKHKGNTFNFLNKKFTIINIL